MEIVRTSKDRPITCCLETKWVQLLNTYESLHCFEIYVDSLTSNQGTCLVLAFATCMHPAHESAIIRVWNSIDGSAIKLDLWLLMLMRVFKNISKCLIRMFISKTRDTKKEITEAIQINPPWVSNDQSLEKYWWLCNHGYFCACLKTSWNYGDKYAKY